MNSFVPSEVLARFRATSRKVFCPKFALSAVSVSCCTCTFRRPFSSYSIPSVLRNSRGSDPPSRTEGRATDVSDINLLDETEGGETRAANHLTAALNSACSSSGRNGVRPLRGGVRRKLMPPLWRARGGVGDLVRGPARSRWLAIALLVPGVLCVLLSAIG